MKLKIINYFMTARIIGLICTIIGMLLDTKVLKLIGCSSLLILDFILLIALKRMK